MSVNQMSPSIQQDNFFVLLHGEAMLHRGSSSSTLTLGIEFLHARYRNGWWEWVKVVASDNGDQQTLAEYL